MGRLNEAIERSISAIDRRRDAQENQVSEAEYNKALLLLSRVSSELQDTLDTAESILSRGISDRPVVSSAMRGGLLECVENCGRQLGDDMLTKEAVQLLQTRSDAARESIAHQWSEYAEEYVKGTGRLLATLSNIIGDPARARSLSESIQSLMREAPSKENVERLVREAAEAKAIIGRYPFSPEIEAFLDKVANSDAHVSDLTPNVEAWLRDNDFTSKLRIVF